MENFNRKSQEAVWLNDALTSLIHDHRWNKRCCFID